MNDFDVYAPERVRSVVESSFSNRSAVTADVDALAAIMAARDGTVEEHVDHARERAVSWPQVMSGSSRMMRGSCCPGIGVVVRCGPSRAEPFRLLRS